LELDKSGWTVAQEAWRPDFGNEVGRRHPVYDSSERGGLCQSWRIPNHPGVLLVFPTRSDAADLDSNVERVGISNMHSPRAGVDNLGDLSLPPHKEVWETRARLKALERHRKGRILGPVQDAAHGIGARIVAWTMSANELNPGHYGHKQPPVRRVKKTHLARVTGPDVLFVFPMQIHARAGWPLRSRCNRRMRRCRRRIAR